MAKKQQGRPPIDPEAGMRIPVAFRATPKVRGLLEDAAEKSGRSMSQEIELRLERSFEKQELLPEVLKLTFRSEIAGLLLAVGSVMEKVGNSAAHEIAAREDRQVRQWSAEPYALDQAIRAATNFLARARPTEGRTHPSIREEVTDQGPLLWAGELARALKGNLSTPWAQEVFGEENLEQIRKLLGSLAEALNTEGPGMVRRSKS